MARPSRTGGKTSEAKARNASPAKGRKTTKTKPRIAPAATRVKRRPVSDPSKDLKEAREQQAATAEILKVIASSPDDVQPVFDAIVTSANRLIGGFSAGVFRLVDGIVHLASYTPVSPAADEALKASFPRPVAELPYFDLAKDGEVSQEADTETSSDDRLKNLARARGFRSRLLAPLVSNKTQIGVIAVTRTTPGPFAAHHVELLQTFADQVVIAIENVRLFNETKEALERQTATTDILKVIASSPSDVQPVFDAIATTANRLIGGFSTTVTRYVGEAVHLAAFTTTDKAGDEALKALFPRPRDDVHHSPELRSGRAVQIPDIETYPEIWRREIARKRGWRSNLLVPLMNDGAPIGMISVTRVETGSFADHHVQLLQTFAAQAVIAIENTRLFNEVQARTRELTEALTYQTGSANILNVIASSPTDIEPVLNAIVEGACELCEANDAAVLLKDGEHLRFRAHHGPIDINLEKWPITRGWTAGRAFLDGKPVHLRDTQSEEAKEFPDSRALAVPPNTNFSVRTVLSVPLLRESERVGAILLRRIEVRPFSDKQIALLQTFADQAVIAINNARLFDEVQAKTRDLSEALTYQTGSANILKVIASSPTDVEPVLKAIVESACELCEAYDAVLGLKVGDNLRISAHHGSIPIPIGLQNWPINRDSVTGRAVVDKVPMHVRDLLSPEGDQYPQSRETLQQQGHRTVLSVPMLREGESIGAIVLRRLEVQPFSEKQIVLLQTFANQAVIAIENTRLFNETQEALEQQTATADILKVIASSPSEVQPVFEAIAERSNRLVQGLSTTVQSLDDDTLHIMAFTRTNPEADAALQASFPRPLSGFPWGERIRRGEIVHIPDVEVELAEFPVLLEVARLRGFRSMLFVPLLREGTVIGIISVTHATPGRFADHHVQLLQTFADQAVIAIGNVRLFDEVQEKTRDLTEALTYQTGSSNILSVIASSPTDVEPVLKAIVGSASELCEADDAIVFLRDGDDLRSAAHSGPIAEGPTRIPIIRTWMNGRSFLDRKPVHVRDILSAEGAKFPNGQKIARSVGHRTMLTVPLLREGESIGVIMLRRKEVHPFSDKQISLLQTFADQAVIAIGNVRLFEEVQAKTADLSESLQQQTATADVLKVISRSKFDLQPVLDTLVETATRLCETRFGFIVQRDGDVSRLVAHHGISAGYAQWLVENPTTMTRGSAGTRAMIDKKTVHVHDVLADPDYQAPEHQSRGGYRTVLGVPLLRGDEAIGAFTLAHLRVKPFTEKQIELVTTFADQAVIAIENVRLFDDLQARTRDLAELLEQQTATADVLQIISASPGDLAPVFEKLLENATRVCGAKFGTMVLIEGDVVKRAALYHVPPAYADAFGKRTFRPHPKGGFGQVIRTKQVAHIADLRTNPGYLEGDPSIVALSNLAGARTFVVVPMLKDATLVGMISVFRQEVRPFSDKQIDLLSNFARQAVIAIENTRLLKELREALQQQTATADVLKVISRSAFDLQTVLETLVVSAARLCEADEGTIFQPRDDAYRLTASCGLSPPRKVFLESCSFQPGTGSTIGRVLLEGKTVHIEDSQADPNYLFQDPESVRTRLGVPLLREGAPIGVFVLTRCDVRPFSEKQIELVTTFADQAVIAIENSRLFNETQEALERQTATAEILKVIASSPEDVQPVFEAIAERSNRIVDGRSTAVYSLVDGSLHLRAFTPTSPEADATLRAFFPRRLSEMIWGEAIARGEMYVVEDMQAPSIPQDARDLAQLRGYRSVLLVPLLRDRQTIGAISVTRVAAGRASDHHIQMLRTFADQAVIAIENVRLFNETKEALAQQTATSEVLEIISSSPGELDPVFHKMLENACRVCEANFGFMQLWDGEGFTSPAAYNVPPELAALRKGVSIRPHPLSGFYATMQTHRIVHLPDITEGEAYRAGVTNVVEIADVGGARTVVIVPLLKEERFIGAIMMYRQEVRPFTDKQIALVENFTKQAVIAIENTRLLRELRERTEALTQSLEELRNAQDRLVQTEKLASLGQLTAGIAHEIKNPLNFVNNFSALSAELTDELNDLLKPAPLDDKMRREADELTGMIKDNLEKVVQHGKRADSIVKNMLLHSREGSREHRPADINSLLDESLNLAYHGARAEKGEFNIILQRDFDADAGTIELFPQEITRAFLNLIANGVYAATRRKTEDNEPGFEPTLRATTKNLGTTVEIRIRDNGTGIPAEVREKMFNPFFTTKPAGEGTGLGLSMTHDIIVKQHGGKIDVETEPGQFAEFIITLPRTIIPPKTAGGTN